MGKNGLHTPGCFDGSFELRVALPVREEQRIKEH